MAGTNAHVADLNWKKNYVFLNDLYLLTDVDHCMVFNEGSLTDASSAVACENCGDGTNQSNMFANVSDIKDHVFPARFYFIWGRFKILCFYQRNDCSLRTYVPTKESRMTALHSLTFMSIDVRKSPHLHFHLHQFSCSRTTKL